MISHHWYGVARWRRRRHAIGACAQTVEAWGVVRVWESDGPRRRKAVCEIWCQNAEDQTVTQVATARAFEDLPGGGAKL
jgi:hypothetical protein